MDYVVYAASVKVANVPELIGTFEDSAAVATGKKNQKSKETDVHNAGGDV